MPYIGRASALAGGGLLAGAPLRRLRLALVRGADALDRLSVDRHGSAG